MSNEHQRYNLAQHQRSKLYQHYFNILNFRDPHNIRNTPLYTCTTHFIHPHHTLLAPHYLTTHTPHTLHILQHTLHTPAPHTPLTLTTHCTHLHLTLHTHGSHKFSSWDPPCALEINAACLPKNRRYNAGFGRHQFSDWLRFDMLTSASS